LIVPATPDLARYVADNLRDEEYIVWRKGREKAAAHTFETARDSVLSWAAITAAGEPVCLFGADGSASDRWASAWMASTPKVDRQAFSICRGIRRVAIPFSRRYWPELRIRPEVRNERQRRFLASLGFAVRRHRACGDFIFEELVI